MLYFLFAMYQDFWVKDRWTGEELHCIYQAIAGQPFAGNAGDAMNDVRMHLPQSGELKFLVGACQRFQKSCAILLAINPAFAVVAESSKGARTEGVKQPRLPGQLLGA